MSFLEVFVVARGSKNGRFRTLQPGFIQVQNVKLTTSIKCGFEMSGVGLTSQVDGLSNGTVQNGILLV